MKQFGWKEVKTFHLPYRLWT